MWTRITLTVMTLASSALSFGAYTLFLRHLGTSERVDLIFYAASVPISVAGVASGALLYLLPPRLTRLSTRAQDSALSLVLAVAGAVTAVAVLLACVSALVQQRGNFWTLWIGFALTAGLQVVSTLEVCLAQARAKYLLCGIAPLVASSGLFAGVLIAIATGREWWLLTGQLAGTIVAVMWLAWGLPLRMRLEQRQDLAVAVAAFAPMKRHALAIGMGTTAFTLFQPVDAALCAQLGGGAMTVMAYAQRVLVALSTAVSLGIYAMAARASHDAVRAGGTSALRYQANRESARIIVSGLAVWLGYEVLGKSVLSDLLSASALRAEDIARLADTLSWMLFGLGPMAAMPYLFRVFYAIEEYCIPAAVGMCVAPAYGLLGWMMLGRLQILALAIAYVIAWWLAFAAAMLCLNGLPVSLAGRGESVFRSQSSRRLTS